jgi:phospholipase/carboxylesterase
MLQLRIEDIAGLTCRIVEPDDEIPPEFVVVLCHGFGAPGTDLVPIAGELARLMGPAALRLRFVFPAAPLRLDDYGLPGGRAWWPIDMARLQAAVEFGEFRDLRRESPPMLPGARDLLMNLLHELSAERSLPFGRFVLGGFSQGSMLATDVALHLPSNPAGLVIWSGTLLREDEWTRLVGARAGLPVLLSHGRSDPLLPFANAEALRDLLDAAGCDVQFLPFPGGHEIPQEVLKATAALLGRLLADELV